MLEPMLFKKLQLLLAAPILHFRFQRTMKTVLMIFTYKCNTHKKEYFYLEYNSLVNFRGYFRSVDVVVMLCRVRRG